jgi:hypothetical protein
MKQYIKKSDAQAEAKRKGLTGVHKMPNGKWMAGKTHPKSTKSTKKPKRRDY